MCSMDILECWSVVHTGWGFSIQWWWEDLQLSYSLPCANETNMSQMNLRLDGYSSDKGSRERPCKRAS